jgi:hypothetical protein
MGRKSRSEKNLQVVRDACATLGRGDLSAMMGHSTFKDGRLVEWRGNAKV